MSRITEISMALSNGSQPTHPPTSDFMGIGATEMMELYRKMEKNLATQEELVKKLVVKVEGLEQKLKDQAVGYEAKLEEAEKKRKEAERKLRQQGRRDPEESVEKWYEIVLLGLGKLVGKGKGKVYVYTAEDEED